MPADLLRAARRRAVAQRDDLAWHVVDELEPLEALREAWQELLRPGQFFVTPSWVLRWLAWRRDAVRPAVVLARDGTGRLRGLLPLARTQDDAWIPCGADVGAVGLDVVAAPGDVAAVAQGAVAFLLTRSWRRLRLERVADQGALHQALLAASPARMLQRVRTYCPFIATAGPWEGLLTRLGKHQRHEMRRKLKRTLEVPGTRVRWVRRREEVAEAMAVLFDLHERRFRATGRDTAFRGDGLRAFHEDLAGDLSVAGQLVLGILERDGQPLACVYGFRCKGRTGLFQSGLDVEGGADGAGDALRIILLRADAEDVRQTELDLLDGCYPWKLRLASGVRRQWDLELFPATVGGRVAHAWVARAQAIRRRLAVVARGPRCPGRCGETVNPAHCRRIGCADADACDAPAA